MEQTKALNPLKSLENQIATASTVKDLLKIEVISNRYIANYEAGTGRKDGREKYEREAFAFMELASANPDIMQCDKVSIFAGFIKAGLTGLSFSGKKLSVYTRNVKSGKDAQGNDVWKKFLVVDPDAHGKKEMMERMPTIKKINEGVIVFKKDKFRYDPKKKLVLEHEQEWPVPEASEENIIGAYCTIEFADKTVQDVVLSLAELKRAREKSTNVTYKEVEGQKVKVKDGGELWNKHFGEACKKTTYNRAYKIYYKTPDTAVIFKQFDSTDETVEASHEDVTQDLDIETGELTDATKADVVQEVEAEIVKPEEIQKDAKPKKARKSLDEA